MKNSRKTVAVSIALLLSGNALMFYALSGAIFALVFLMLAALFLYVRWQNAIALSVSLALTTLILALAFQVLITSEAIYYRPHEMFSHPDGRYEKNVQHEMAMPHGDLKALALYTEVPLEPREVVFETDSLGYRNTNDYHGQKYLLVGDSFIVGNGTSQQNIITEQLFNRHGIDTYNLAYPGGMKDYANYVKSFRQQTGSNARVILFLFEGNDFPVNEEGDPDVSEETSGKGNPVVAALKDYRRLIRSTDMYRFIYSSTRRIYTVNIKKQEETVELSDIAGIPVGFYKPYINDTERDVLPKNAQTEKYVSALKDEIAHIFFIPTKHRVYYRYRSGEKPQSGQMLPDRQWQFVRLLGEKFDIPTTNLTPALIAGSDSLLEQGVLTYWRDDTHWNKHGIAIAADRIMQELSSSHLTGQNGNNTH